MPEDVYIQYIKGISTESAAATLTEGEIQTGATPGGMLKSEAIGLELRQVITEFGSWHGDEPAEGLEESMNWALSVSSGLTAIPGVDDIHCIYKRNFTVHAGVAVYLPQIAKEMAYPPVHDFMYPLLIPHPKIYDYILSTSGSAENCRWALGFTYVALSGPQVMEALEVWRSVVA